jgi:hypothetical protein
MEGSLCQKQNTKQQKRAGGHGSSPSSIPNMAKKKKKKAKKVKMAKFVMYVVRGDVPRTHRQIGKQD